MDDVALRFSVNAVAASHVAFAQCVEACVRLPDEGRPRDREAFGALLDEQFREFFRADYGLSPEEQDELRWIWAALRKTLRSPTLEKFERQTSATQ